MVRCTSLAIVVTAVFLPSINLFGAQDQIKLLGTSIAVCYLQATKKHQTPHDVQFNIKKDTSNDKKQLVVITTTVFGAPEEFEGKGVLDTEKNCLLKYKLIYAYLAQQAKMNARSFAWLRSNDWNLDSSTQVIRLPTNHSEYAFLSQHRAIYTDRYTMQFVTTLASNEFDALEQKHSGAATSA